MPGIANPTCNNCTYSASISNEPRLVCYKGPNAGLYMQPTDKCNQWNYKGDTKMPPLKKRAISNLDEIRCECCLLGIPKYALGNHIKCHHMDMWASDPTPDFYCSEGLWIVSISRDRQSVVDFSVAYNHLMEKD